MDLSDDFILVTKGNVTIKKLAKLPVSTQCGLTLKWMEQQNRRKKDLADVIRYLKRIQSKRRKKRSVAPELVRKFFGTRFTMLQLAQLDCEILYQKPNSHSWSSFLALNSRGERIVLDFEPQSLVRDLQRDLGRIFMCHFYFGKYPNLPAVIGRFQLFDRDSSSLKSNSKDKEQIGKNLITRAPFFVAFPMNSSFFLTSSQTDMYAQLIVESLRRALSKYQSIRIISEQIEASKDIRSLLELHGVSRAACSLGPWSSYADATFETSPLADAAVSEVLVGKHVSPKEFTNVASCQASKAEIRFKGSSENSAIGSGNGQSYHSRFASKYPATNLTFTSVNRLQNKVNVGFGLKLRGRDVFGGLHELCERGHIDVEKLPGWLAGENGIKSGKIEDGQFRAFEKDSNSGQISSKLSD